MLRAYLHNDYDDDGHVDNDDDDADECSFGPIYECKGFITHRIYDVLSSRVVG